MAQSHPANPTTRSPTNQWGETLSRFSKTLDGACPSCGAAVEVWITEGATSARGVCVSCDAEVDEDVLREVSR